MPPPYRTATMIAATTGLRFGEVLTLRWDVIDLEASPPRRRHAAAGCRRGVRGVAEDRPRSPDRPIPPMLVAALRRHRAEPLERRLTGFGEA